jgi:serine/threonine-protein kinase
MSRHLSIAVCLLIAGLLPACSSPKQAAPNGSQQKSQPTAPQQSPNSSAAAGAMFNTGQPWTADVSGAAPSERSQAIIGALKNAGGWGTGNAFNIDFSIPVFYADANTPRRAVVGVDGYCGEGPDCDAVPAEIPIPANAYVEGSTDLRCDITGDTEGQGDCHLLVVDKDAGKLYEIYQGNQVGENISAQAFFVWDLKKDYPETLRGDQCTSADAAGFPIAALTPTADEVASGELHHAIRFILPNDRIKEEVYVRPATHAGGPKSTDPSAPPYGVRFRLRADFDESSYNQAQRVILRALKTHGMLLADGGQVPLTFADDKTSTAKWADLGIDAQSFSGISVDKFEVVELGDEIPLTYDCVRNP